MGDHLVTLMIAAAVNIFVILLLFVVLLARRTAPVFDSDFESSNYNLFKTDISVNKFVTSFEFLREDDEVGSESYLTNETAYNFSDAYSLKYRTRRNEKTDFTEFYNLIYEYKNDCLTASIQYNKDYYSDNELKPTEEIFFSISIVPLTTLNTPRVR